ncbi:hydroxyisourate hydrolase [Brucella tritici]|uniref:hydroxyisourate hydrolase n=1 Tax=Brucella tritici TaxID=94626 RepID=UPI001AEE658F|nr:hydroxyisourate hydrolase [Brucella tritici]
MISMKRFVVRYFFVGVLSLVAGFAWADESAPTSSNPLSVHVLDLMTGAPAKDITVTLEKEDGKNWMPLSSGVTGEDGRISALYPGNDPTIGPGDYRITFQTGAYFEKQQSATIFSEIPVVIHLTQAEQHIHVPLLLSRYGYSTYKGSK